MHVRKRTGLSMREQRGLVGSLDGRTESHLDAALRWNFDGRPICALV